MAVWIDYVLLTSYGHETEAHTVQIRLQERVEQLEEQLAIEAEQNTVIEKDFDARLKRVNLEKLWPFVGDHNAQAPYPIILLLWKVIFWP